MPPTSTAPAQGSPPIPTLTEPFGSEPGTANAGPPPAEGDEKKPKKRSLFGFGKKKTEDPAKPLPKAAPHSKDAAATSRTTAASPVQADHPHFSPSSPGRSGFGSSPRLASPAGSQIFERDVQESASLMPNSPAIPSHIATENYIPPVLDASSEAITDDHLDPDNVEIITHTSHQPASVAVTGISLSPSYEPSWTDELAAFSAGRTTTAATASPPPADSASNYGSLDTTDIRRLSFISFADVVQAEQQQFPNGSGSGGPSASSHQHLAGLASFTPLGAANRSPSPVRSPVSSAGGAGRTVASSPPTSKSGSVRGLEMASPDPRQPLGSPTSMTSMRLGLPPLQSPGSGSGQQGQVVNGELAIETMSQALRRTGSGDLGAGQGMRSFPGSPV
ncbi:hypothetical protein BT67DRAFT_22098 [Trichocladium antarcticum]|uniref:Uncharacterized protein n=1 Tax=Trichocladium antarcticum TaxID=1450529 RepID=A0AAN6UT75_9PEZI|nr:hypothetical protein BT67DRAFT_22098 [Trichocladium antarcticum]